MHDYQIRELTDRIADALKLSEPMALIVKSTIQDYFKDYFCGNWQIEDIEDRYKEMLEDRYLKQWGNPILLYSDFEQIATILDHDFDASIGINWDTIDGAILDYIEDNFPKVEVY